MSAGPSTCPACSSPLVPGALEGLCPRCVARAVFAPADAATPPGDGVLGEQIGPYTLREILGKSGGATVWLAEQERPVQRLVALKIFPPGVALNRLRARAALEHPPALVLASGMTQWGRPYLVAELVLEKPRIDTAQNARLGRSLRPVQQFVQCHRRACACVLALLAALGLARSVFLRAQEGRRVAEMERSTADDQRRRTEAEATQARALTPAQRYATDIRLAEQARLANQRDRARELLDRQRPTPGGADLRGWEWRWLWQQLREPDAPAAGGQMLAADVVFALLLPGGQTAYAVNTAGRRYLLDLATLRQTPLPLTAPGLGLFTPPNFVGFHDGAGALELYALSERGAERIAAVPVGPQPPPSIAYAPALRTLAWAAVGAAIRVAKVDNHAETFELTTAGEFGSPASFDATGRYLLGVGPQGEARVWDVAARRRLPAAETYFSPDRLPVFGSERNALGSRALMDWIATAIQPAVAERHAIPAANFWPRGRLVARAFSPDGQTSAVASERGEVVLFDVVGGARLATIPGDGRPILALAFSPDGLRLASGGGHLWGVSANEELLRLPTVGGAPAIVQFSDDGATLLIGSTGRAGASQFWRAPSWEEIARVERSGGGWRVGR